MTPDVFWLGVLCGVAEAGGAKGVDSLAALAAAAAVLIFNRIHA